MTFSSSKYFPLASIFPRACLTLAASLLTSSVCHALNLRLEKKLAISKSGYPQPRSAEGQAFATYLSSTLHPIQRRGPGAGSQRLTPTRRDASASEIYEATRDVEEPVHILGPGVTDVYQCGHDQLLFSPDASAGSKSKSLLAPNLHDHGHRTSGSRNADDWDALTRQIQTRFDAVSAMARSHHRNFNSASGSNLNSRLGFTSDWTTTARIHENALRLEQEKAERDLLARNEQQLYLDCAEHLMKNGEIREHMLAHDTDGKKHDQMKMDLVRNSVNGNSTLGSSGGKSKPRKVKVLLEAGLVSESQRLPGRGG